MSEPPSGQLDEAARPAASSPTTRRSRLLPAARAACIGTIVLTIGLSIAAIPLFYAHYQTVCYAGPECRPYLFELAPKDALALRQLGLSASFYSAYLLAVEIVYMLGFWFVGAVIYRKKSDEWPTLVFSLMLVTFGGSNIVQELASTHPTLDLLSACVVFLGWVLLFVSFFVFPDGRLVPRWGLWPIVIWTLHEAALSFAPVGSIVHPDAWPPIPTFLLVLGLFGTVLFAQVHRYRQVSGPLERQQTKWVVFGLVVAIILATVAILPLAAFEQALLEPGLLKVLYAMIQETVVDFSLLLIPVSIGVAVLRYRLWDIDVIINRTLVYGALTASLVGLYALMVGAVGALSQRVQGSFIVSLLATGLVAVLFAPLRDALQRGVNRFMYGERDDPYGVLSRLGQRLEATLEPAAVLPTIAETVAGAFRLPYAAISLRQGDGFEIAAAYGAPTTRGQTTLPLKYQGETIGQLILAPRAPGESFTLADRRLLEDVARSAEVAVHAVCLTADLQRSRERLVTAREEERRRLRRDLHDGVGPRLAALMLELETAGDLVADHPEASNLMRRLSDQARETVADVRRSVHALRPPALDELGLVGALREAAAQHGRAGVLEVSVYAPEPLPPLPAAAEVACYLIAQEAMTNAVRHARAGNCQVRLAPDEEAGALILEVEDDGRGVGEYDRVGVGMCSMRERAEELGGRCAAGPAEGGGTLVRALLPLPTAEIVDREEE